MHFALRARKNMNVYRKLPCAVKVYPQFLLKMQSLAKMKKNYLGCKLSSISVIIIDYLNTFCSNVIHESWLIW